MLKHRAAVPENPLRVAIVTASLGLAGAEKQAFYIAKSLAEAGIAVRVYNLSRGGEYEEALREMHVESRCFGWAPSFPLRLALLVSSLRSFRPNIIQSVHAYTNAYSALAGRILGAVSVGGLRSDLTSCLAENGRFARRLLTLPDGIAVNSKSAVEELRNAGLVDLKRVHFLPNAIDLETYPVSTARGCKAIFVSRLLPSKRPDMFVRALAQARMKAPELTGVVVGYGREEERVRKLAEELGLLPSAVTFLGFRDDIASLLQQASMFVFCSESEGTPNVVLEAMAASLPVITTPAGDAAEIVEQAEAGFVVKFGDVEAAAEAMVQLARSPELRRKLGSAGRTFVARTRASSELAGRLLTIYRDVARRSTRGSRGDFARRISERLERSEG